MGLCDLISANLAVDCDNLPGQGAKCDGYIFNLSDLASSTPATGGPVTLLTFASTKQAYKVTLYKDDAMEPSYALREGTYRKGVEHKVRMIMHVNGQTNKDQLKEVLNGKFGFIIEDGKSAFEWFGRTYGLECNVLEKNYTDEEIQGGIVVELTTGKYSEEELPVDVFDTDIATTRAMLESLLTPAP